jgi:hypothetical protein
VDKPQHFDAAMKTIQIFQQAQQLPPGQQSRYISVRLPGALAGSKIGIWNPEASIPKAGRRTLLGVAPYASLDLKLLDALCEAMDDPRNQGERMEMFDILACTDMRDVQARIPEIGNVPHTPILGVWENGMLILRASGAKARQILVERYDLTL